MSKKEQDILYFISFCIEQYKHEMGVSGSEVMDLFDRSGLLDYLSENYEVLHTQGHRWLIEASTFPSMNRLRASMDWPDRLPMART